MSRGHGKIERFILDHLDRRGELVAVVVLAQHYADACGVETTKPLRASFRRAAAKLTDSGEVIGWEVQAPTMLNRQGEGTHPAWFTCVGPVGMEPTEADCADAALGVALFHCG